MKMYHYTGFQGHKACCGLSIIPSQHDSISFYIVLTELGKNPGTSITNTYATIATSVYREFLANQSPEHLLWVEHYTSASYCPETGQSTTFDRVYLT